MTPPAAALARLVEERRVLVCVGSGGVGKTTTAAAIGLEAARRGRRVLVLTIDPARRLANALGLPSFGNEIRTIEVPDAAPGGALAAVMLDTRATFDDLIQRMAPDEASRQRILQNPIYRIVSDSFAGSQEYMATEKLYDVHLSGRYDLVVLDTPPVKNALDFLEAPGRLARFLDRRIIRWFLAPYDENRVFGRVLVGTSGVVFRLLGVVFGREFLGELSNFFLAFKDMYEGFRERSEAVDRLLADRGTGFLVIAAPTEPSLEVAAFFRDELTARRLPLDGFVVNQVHRCAADEADVERLGSVLEALATDLPDGTAGRLLGHLRGAWSRLCRLEEDETPNLQRLRGLARGARVRVEVPLLAEPIRDMAGLRALNRHLFAPQPPS